MAIEVELSAKWSELNWEKSWKSIVDLEELLPQVGKKYALPIEMNTRVLPFKMNYHNIVDGKAYFLWAPPHSELNGWHDKRPSEILNSFVIEGLVDTRKRNLKSVDFVVSRLIKLTDLFENVKREKHTTLLRVGLADGASRFHWEESVYTRIAHVNHYIYLFGRDRAGGSEMELILSRDSDKLCIHYSADRGEYTDSSARITKHILDEAEQLMIETLLKQAKVVVDNSMDELPEGKVFGAEYH